MLPNNLAEVLSAPLGALIAEIGRGVADAQEALDNSALDQLERIYTSDEGFATELRALGYRPTWYHIPSAEAELHVALKLSGSIDHRTGAAKRTLTTYAAPVDASYRNTYDYDVSASSTVRFTVVPIPEPPQLEGRDVVPALEGMTITVATSLLERLGIAYEIEEVDAGTGVAAATDPPAGSLIEPGQVVRVISQTLSEDDPS